VCVVGASIVAARAAAKTRHLSRRRPAPRPSPPSRHRRTVPPGSCRNRPPPGRRRAPVPAAAQPAVPLPSRPALPAPAGTATGTRPAGRPAVPRRPDTSTGTGSSYIDDLIAAAPPLTAGQRDKLALLLRTRPARPVPDGTLSGKPRAR
jgi:hypothetical protein